MRAALDPGGPNSFEGSVQQGTLVHFCAKLS